MDPRLLRYYNRELEHVREMGEEFARDFPKIAGRLGLEGLECADPYVERLLEGFAFLAARVQLKIDAEFPEFTAHLLQMLYPHFLAPTPSMAVVQFQPDLREAGLAAGYRIPAGSVLQSQVAKDQRTACSYRTAHEVTLFPLEIAEARYLPTAASLAAAKVNRIGSAKAGLRLQLRTTAGVPMNQLALGILPIYLAGADELPKTIYEQVLGDGLGFVVRPKDGAWQESFGREALTRVGFGDDEALLPYVRRSFRGYRLLQEYFAFPERYLFFALADLGRAMKRHAGGELEVIVLLKRSVPSLEGSLDHKSFRLCCSPVINLSERRLDRIHLDRQHVEYHVVPDRTRPMDFEVFDIVGVEGFGAGSEPEQRFAPFYSSTDASWHRRDEGYFVLRREPRVLSARQQQQGPRSSYVGSESFVSLVDASQAPFSHSLRQLQVTALVTNRDLPLQMPLGKGRTDFMLESGAPLEAVRCVAGPTRPRPSPAFGEHSWRLLSHLSLNYLSIVDSADGQGASALRELLGLYTDANDVVMQKQIEGVESVATRPLVARLPQGGPIALGRGLEIKVTVDDGAFQGMGSFVLGSVLEEFFARQVGLNSFTATVLCSSQRGEIMRWPPRTGRRALL